MDASRWKLPKALLSFDTGAGGADLLVGALDADLAAGVRVRTLSKLLDHHNGIKPLPADVYQTLAARLNPDEDVRLGADDVTVDLEAPLHPKPVSALFRVDIAGPPLAGRYQLLELVGKGGTSEVYKAIDLHQAEIGDSNYHVAIKLMPRGAISVDAQPAIERLLGRLKELVHVNIARPLDWGDLGEMYYIAFEYVAGHTLYELLRRSPIPLAQAILIIGKMADGLAAAHRQSLVHGDLKPGNVLVTDAGEVRLIDFGLEGATGRVAGTPRYASPQRMQRLAAEQSDDVFALACIAFELLTGQPAFAGIATSRDPLQLPSSERLSESQRAALAHAMSPDRLQRTASAALFVQELLGSPAARPRSGWWQWLPAALIAGAVIGFLARQFIFAPRPAPPASVMVPAPVVPASSEPGTLIRDCPTCAALRVIPAGTLVRGSNTEAKSTSAFEKPQQTVTIAYPLAVSINPVTVGEFQAFADAVGRPLPGCDVYDGRWHVDAAASWQNPGFRQTLLHPVTCVSYQDATAYAAWLSQKTGHHYRLPSAAEWEYAARAGAPGTPWATPAEACKSANVADQSAERRYPGFAVFACDDGYVNTAPVGSYAANAFGLFDMLGNVFSWTEDCWSDTYAGTPHDGSAVSVGNCGEREARGGSWFSTPAYVRAAYRNHFAADYRGSSVGIRLVRDLSP